jgi:hypothetical protein
VVEVGGIGVNFGIDYSIDVDADVDYDVDVNVSVKCDVGVMSVSILVSVSVNVCWVASMSVDGNNILEVRRLHSSGRGRGAYGADDGAMSWFHGGWGWGNKEC